ncbi:hypothetical protein IJG72_08325 [bacterium]|nr:hypothetical protein [bacterium]
MPIDVLSDIKTQFDKSYLPYIVNFTDYNVVDEHFYNLIKDDLVSYDA